MHGIPQQVLDHFARQRGLEPVIVVGKEIALRIEQIDIALEWSAAHAGGRLPNLAQYALVRAVHFAVSLPPLKKWRELHIAAQLEYPAAGSRPRYQRERSSQPGQMFLEILARSFVRQVQRLELACGGVQIRGAPRGGHWNISRHTRLIASAQKCVYAPQCCANGPQIKRHRCGVVTQFADITSCTVLLVFPAIVTTSGET